MEEIRKDVLNLKDIAYMMDPSSSETGQLFGRC